MIVGTDFIIGGIGKMINESIWEKFKEEIERRKLTKVLLYNIIYKDCAVCSKPRRLALLQGGKLKNQTPKQISN